MRESTLSRVAALASGRCPAWTACNVHDGASRRHAHIVQHTSARASRHSTARVTGHVTGCAGCCCASCGMRASFLAAPAKHRITSCRDHHPIQGSYPKFRTRRGFLRRTKRGPIALTRDLTLGRRPKAIYTLTRSESRSGHAELTPPAGLHPSRVPWPLNGALHRPTTR